MLLLAWSLVQSAVNYARRQRLTAVLQRHLYAPFACQTGIACHQMPAKLFGNRLTPADAEGERQCRVRGSGPPNNNGMYKAPSEPALNQETIVLYRTEQLEIVAVPKPSPLQIVDWTLITTSKRKHNTVFLPHGCARVSFIAVIEPNPNFCPPKSQSRTGSTVDLSRSGSKDELISLVADDGTQSTAETGSTTRTDVNNDERQFSLILLSSLANQIAFHSLKPNEVLYETDLEHFYELVFQWSEGALFDFDGRGIVRELTSVQLPDLHATNSDFEFAQFSSSMSCASTSALAPISPSKPFTLLEYLYLKELYGDLWEKSSYLHDSHWDTMSLQNGTNSYRSVSTLRRAISPSGSLYRQRRAAALPPPAPPRSSSPDSMTASPSASPVPPYIRQLRQRQLSSKSTDRRRTVSLNNASGHCSASVTFDDLVNGLKFIDHSSIEEESDDSARLRLNNSSTRARHSTRRDLESYVAQVRVSNGATTPPVPKSTKPDSSRVSGGRHSLKKRRSSYSVASEKFARMTEAIARHFHLDVNAKHENMPERKRFSSLIPAADSHEHQARRRSLSPLTLSIVANYAQIEPSTAARSTLFAVEKFPRRRSCTPTRRRFHSIPGHSAESTLSERAEPRPPQKPPTILVYTGNNSNLFNRIFLSLQKILPENTYTIFHLTSKALVHEPWVDENAVCVLLADTSSLGDAAWSRLQSYFVHSGKIVFLCQNSLLSNLTSCQSSKKQANLLKAAFCNKNANISLGKDFEQFLRKSAKSLSKSKDVNEIFHAKDLVGGYRYSVVFHKKHDQPLLLYMENSQNNASALFSDATAEQLIADGGNSLIADAMKRLGIKISDDKQGFHFSPGYFMCEPDRLTWNMKGLSYGVDIGSTPKLHFQSSEHLIAHRDSFPHASASLLPVEVCRRKTGFPQNVEFDAKKYYDCLATKSLGKALLFVPVCETTMNLSKSLSAAMPTFDGILVTAGHQTKGSGRSGNQWLSPRGCAMFTFNFNIPLNSALGQSISFVQHILAVAIVDAVTTLLQMDDFPLKIKWPNDIYYNRMFKMGGILVTSSIYDNMVCCVIGAGLNVANSKPTVCINDMLPEGSDCLLTVEEVTAMTMNKFEHYVHLFENSGKQAFLKRYYDFWLHTREEITIQNAESDAKERVVIRGLDPYGYLEVRSKQNGKVFSVQEDGNTFDMMKGLIRPKHKPS